MGRVKGKAKRPWDDLRGEGTARWIQAPAPYESLPRIGWGSLEREI